MPHVLEKTVYNFAELDETAKERARDWYRAGNLDYDWFDSCYEDFEQVAKILGIEFNRQRTNNPKAIGGPCIYFSGFSSQGDGASVEGRYDYAKGAPKAIRSYAPQDMELHRIADELQAIQRKWFYGLSARIVTRGNYSHSHSMEIDVSDFKTGDSPDEATEEAIRELLRDFANWMYRQLEASHDWLQADEQVDESIEANGYEFTAEGRIA